MFKAATAAGLAMALALAASPGQAAEPAPAPDHRPIPTDPAIRQGVLANGLRYRVLGNASPRGGLSIRLGIDVGSFEEADDERGVAHFIEHMAFRSTAGFPEGALDKAFAPSGVAYGRDQNARTDIWATRYELDLHDSTDAHLDLALHWLRDVADGVVFAADAVDRERGVVLAEKAARDSPAEALVVQVTAFESPELRGTARRPVGTEAVLKTVTPDRLKAFYDRWYRPEHAVVVIVGDLPADQLEARVKAAFGSWTARGPKPRRAVRPPPSLTRGLDALAISEPRLPTFLGACRIQAVEADRADDIASLRGRLLRELWVKVVNQRLNQVRAKESAVLRAQISASPDTQEARETCLVVSPTADTWEPALGLAQAELLRFAHEGPTEHEAEQAIEDQRSDLVAGITQAATRDSGALAGILLDRALIGRTYPQPRDSLRNFDLAVDGLSPGDIKAAFDRDWAGAGPLLVLSTPKAPPREALLAAWTGNDKAKALASYADTKAARWAYVDPPKPGKVVQRQVLQNPDFVRLRFANGVVLNFKHTDFAQGAVEIRVRFGEGRREVPDSGYMASQLALGLFPAGGLGRHSYEELAEIFGNTELQFNLAMTDRYFSMSKAALAEDLGSQSRLLAAYFTDPGFRDSLDPKIPTAIEMTYRVARTSLPITVFSAVTEAAVPGLPTNLPPQSTVMGLKSADFARLLKPALTQAPLDVTVVGDIDEADAVRQVAASFGALAPRGPRIVPPNRIAYLRFPEGPRPEARTTHEGSTDKAAALLVWPLYVATPTRRREEYALKALADVYANELRHEVREHLGKTYSPQVQTHMPDLADQGQLYAYLETQPADLAAVQAAAAAVATRLAQGGVTEEMFTAARSPRLAEAHGLAQSNRWWAAAISGSALDDSDLRDVLANEPLIAQVTLDDVRQAATTWLTRAPLVGVTLPAAPAKPEVAR